MRLSFRTSPLHTDTRPLRFTRHHQRYYNHYFSGPQQQQLLLLLLPPQQKPHRYRTATTMASAQQVNEYKLKLDSIPSKNGDKVEAETEGLDGGKVLLMRVNGLLKALGPKCTRM